MILTLKVKLAGGMYVSADWQGEIEIDENDTLEHLHFAIQDAVNFDNDHMYEFFIAKTPRSRDREVFDLDGDEGTPLAEQIIGELFPLPEKMSIYYLFDYGDEWMFKILKSRKAAHEAVKGIQYPRLVAQTGVAPEQYPGYDEEE